MQSVHTAQPPAQPNLFCRCRRQGAVLTYLCQHQPAPWGHLLQWVQRSAQIYWGILTHICTTCQSRVGALTSLAAEAESWRAAPARSGGFLLWNPTDESTQENARVTFCVTLFYD